jgi:myo-inositol-1(or 4)-monophosphatase
VRPADARALLDVARAAALAGAEVASGWRLRAGDLVVGEKAASDDLVSQADTDTEDTILDVLLQRRPQDGVLAEERGSHDGSTGIRWVIDPIDGTTNYVYGRPDWAVSVAALDADDRVLAGVVVEPAVGRVTEACAGGGAWTDGRRLPPLMQHDLSRALVEVNLGAPSQKPCAGGMVAALVPHVRDVRRGGSAATALAQVAAGRADAAWVPGLQPWDCAAGILLVSEAGGVVGDLSGPTPHAVPASGDVLAASPALWEPLRRLLLPAYRDAPGRGRQSGGSDTASAGASHRA